MTDHPIWVRIMLPFMRALNAVLMPFGLCPLLTRSVVVTGHQHGWVLRIGGSPQLVIRRYHQPDGGTTI